MRFLASFALASVALLLLTACNSVDSSNKGVSISPPATPAKPQTTPAAAPTDGVRRITIAELKDLLSKGQAYVVDVRNEAAYNIAHARGAKLIPHDQIGERSKELPSDKTIVTYCSCGREQTSVAAVLELKKKGLENAAALLGGMDAWKNAGLPVDSVK